jgi:hypothetical protein
MRLRAKRVPTCGRRERGRPSAIEHRVRAPGASTRPHPPPPGPSIPGGEARGKKPEKGTKKGTRMGKRRSQGLFVRRQEQAWVKREGRGGERGERGKIPGFGAGAKVMG